jgi:3,4-dihydroxy 2-butanone 4-phosphate synthase / GTP cyclohydrolase II
MTQVSTYPSVEPIASATMPSRFGPFRITGYQSLVSSETFLAFSTGQLAPELPTLVRIHSQCLTGEVFGSLRCDCAAQLETALSMIEKEGRGVIVYQFQEGRGIGLINKIKAYALQDQGLDTIEANARLGFAPDLRTFHQCAEILLHLNLRQVRILSNNPDKIKAVRDAGLEIVERVTPSIDVPTSACRYLRTKKEEMGHLLDAV